MFEHGRIITPTKTTGMNTTLWPYTLCRIYISTKALYIGTLGFVNDFICGVWGREITSRSLYRGISLGKCILNKLACRFDWMKNYFSSLCGYMTKTVYTISNYQLCISGFFLSFLFAPLEWLLILLSTWYFHFRYTRPFLFLTTQSLFVLNRLDVINNHHTDPGVI